MFTLILKLCLLLLELKQYRHFNKITFKNNEIKQ